MTEYSAPLSWRTTPAFPEADTLSYDSVDNSLRVQLWLVNRCLDEVQREFYKSKEGHSESTLAGSPFIQEIQDKPIPLNFHLSTLEAYDDGSDLVKHVATF